MEKNVLIGAIIFIVIVASAYFIFKSNQDSQIIFSVFKDAMDNPKGSFSINQISIPLNDEEACIVAKEACESSSCLSVKRLEDVKQESSKEYINIYKQTFGDSNLMVGLEPVCGPTTAYINEKEKKIICFCAYE